MIDDPTAELTLEDIRRLCGDISDAAAAAIIASGASIADLERALVADAEDMTSPEAGAVGAVRSILSDGTGWEEERPD